MERWVGRVALVTGASSGIGADIAKRFVSMGMKVVGCGRNIKNIEDLAASLADRPGSLVAVHCDMNSDSDIARMFERVRELYGKLDVLVNNAGLCHGAPLLTGATEHWREMMNVNVLAVCICAREAFKLMKDQENGDGHIFYISSLLAKKQSPSSQLNFYAATKCAVHAMAESLNTELREIKSNIRVTSISPGLVETQWLYKALPNNQDFVAGVYQSYKALEAHDVTEAVVYALCAPSDVQVRDVILSGRNQVP